MKIIVIGLISSLCGTMCLGWVWIYFADKHYKGSMLAALDDFKVRVRDLFSKDDK